jgi:hypothetical protein
LPAIFYDRRAAEAGGLMNSGANIMDARGRPAFTSVASGKSRLTSAFGPLPSSVYITTCPQLAKAAVRAADEGGGL